MLDIGWTELLVIGIVLIVVVGPKDLPPMLRAFGKMTANLRKMAGEFRTQFDEALRETEMDEVRKTISDAQKLNPSNALRDAINPLRQMGQDIRNDLEKSTRVEKAPEAKKLDSALVDQEAQDVVEGVIPDEQPAPVTVPKPAVTLPNTPPPMTTPTTSTAGEAIAVPTVSPGATTTAEASKPVRRKAGIKAVAADAAPVAEAVKPKRTRVSAASKSEAAPAPAAPRKRTSRKTETPKDQA